MAMVFCRDCGAKHSDKAKACPKCGRSVCAVDKSVLIYTLLALCFGVWGVHKFYAGRRGEGVVMLLMGTVGWLLIIPGLVVCIWAFVDFIIGLVNMDSPDKIFAK